MLNVSILRANFSNTFSASQCMGNGYRSLLFKVKPNGRGPCRNPDFQLEIRFPVAGMGTRVRKTLSGSYLGSPIGMERYNGLQAMSGFTKARICLIGSDRGLPTPGQLLPKFV